MNKRYRLSRSSYYEIHSSTGCSVHLIQPRLAATKGKLGVFQSSVMYHAYGYCAWYTEEQCLTSYMHSISLLPHELRYTLPFTHDDLDDSLAMADCYLS
jgi:hypothetical protein